MKILIQGRKNGYTVLYPKPTPKEFYSFASDIQSISANNDEEYYGKNFYTLAFVDGGCVFTKYVIGDDVERGQLGEIGISVFIPNTQKLSGANVKTLLDALITSYCGNYISDHKIDEPKNGFDWMLFTSLANDYVTMPCSSHDDNFTSGGQDPAFHYYKSEIELIEHLDKPFQEEYCGFRQILFIESNLQGAANPLDVIKNSGVEVNPDLKNEYFYLNNYNRSKGVKITVYFNNKWNERSDKKGENQIREKWPVNIKYSKDYYRPIEASGSISNFNSDIYKYLEINGSNLRIKYDNFLPDPITRTFTFDVYTKKDNVKVIDAEIQVDTQLWQNASTITFEAEELGREHEIVARKGETLFSDVVKITPKDYAATSIPLSLIKKMIVKIIAEEINGEKHPISDFKVWVSNGKCDTQKVNEVTFVGDEIDKTWNITVEKDGYTRSNSEVYCPKNGESTIYFKLKKSPKQSTTETNSQNERSSLDSKEKQKTFVLKTFFTRPTVIVISVVSVLVLCAGTWVKNQFFGKNKPNVEILLNKSNIKNYVEGDSLFLNTLNEYKKKWRKQEQDFIAKSGGGLFGGEEKADSARWKKDWQPVNESIDRAIKKRKLVDNKNFAELRNQRYSDGQLSFKAAIEKINSTKYTEVGTQLGVVSTLTLKQIAKKINDILKPKEPENEETPQEPITEGKNTKREQETSEKNEPPKEQFIPQEQETAATDKTPEILQYINGSELDEAKLKEYKSTTNNKNLKNSIQLCLDFWKLDGSGSGNTSKTYFNFRKKVNQNQNFDKSKLKEFLNEMSQEGVIPSYSKQDKKQGLK